MYQDVGKTVSTCTKYTINSSKVWKRKKNWTTGVTTDDTVHGFGFYSSMTTENVTVHNNSTSFMALIMLKNTCTCS